MKKNKKVLFEIILFIIFAIFISSIILNKPIGDMDEIWNYNFASNISKGLVPYKDFNMVQTPLLAIVTGIILKIFSNSLIVTRILAILLSTSILFLSYKICDKLKINKSINLLAVAGLLILLSKSFSLDYNFFALFLTLIIIYLELKLDMKKKSSNLVIGIIAGLTLLTKQTIGAFVCLSVFTYKLIFEIYKYKTKKEKIDVKSLVYRVVGGIAPVAIFVIYLAVSGALNDFVDYAILGIQTFSNKIRYINLLGNKELIIRILAIYVPISFVAMAIYSIKKRDKNLFIILLLSLSMFVVAFPISDTIHFLIGIVPSLIGSIYLLNRILKKIYTEKLIILKIFVKAFSYLILLYFLFMGIYNEYLSLKQNKYYSQLKHFEYIPTTKEYDNSIKIMDEYIKNSGKKVYILNFDAAIYMIPIDIYNKNYDMLLKGNLGIKGEDEIIANIENTDDSVFLVLNKNYLKNWQHPNSITDFVEKNLKHLGSINNYEIYSKKGELK